MKTFTAVQLAKEMKLPPKRVRSILRKAGFKHDGRWKFPVEQKAKMKETVRAARRRATVAPVVKRRAEVEHRVH